MRAIPADSRLAFLMRRHALRAMDFLPIGVAIVAGRFVALGRRGEDANGERKWGCQNDGEAQKFLDIGDCGHMLSAETEVFQVHRMGAAKQPRITPRLFRFLGQSSNISLPYF